MKHWFEFVILTSFLAFAQACGKTSTDPDKPKAFDISLILPGYIELAAGENLTLSVKDGKAPLLSDVMQFKSGETGSIFQTNIKEVTSSKVTVETPKALVSGQWTLTVKRNEQKKTIGTTTIKITEHSDFDPSAGTTVYGKVICEGNGVPGVVVSDGFEVTTTNREGFYELKSAKKYGYVFISVPSGYEVLTDGVLPRFSNKTLADASSCERSDFELKKADSQDSYTMLFFGDMHLANRNSDINQFNKFAGDVMDFSKKNPGKEYAMTLGDMTWDIYWYDNKYSFAEYLKTVNGSLEGLPIFHTMGNHDNDYKALNDWDAEKYYVSEICPKYYSFNIGKIHYVVLDDIDCSTYDGTTERNYVCNITSEQLLWLTKDLEHVSKSNPVIVTSHSNIFRENGNAAVSNASALVGCFEGFEAVHFVTGHTHVCFNIDEMATKHYFEHNAGAVCATWWWTGKDHSSLFLSKDGSLGGYTVMSINGTDIRWQYKSTDKDISHQFRTYDRNSMDFSKVSKKSGGVSDSKWKTLTATWSGASNANEVYINIWNWDPAWNVEVSENGNSLSVERVTVYDPLHILAYDANHSTSSFVTNTNSHTFKVKATSANSTLEIKVTDRFGNVYTESMKRPKAFSIEAYK